MANVTKKLKSGQLPYLLILLWPISFLYLSRVYQVFHILQNRRSLSFSFNKKDFTSDMASQKKKILYLPPGLL